MANCCDTQICKVRHIGLSNITTRLELSIKYWLEYSLLTIGGWTEIKESFPSPLPCLRAVDCPGVTDGTCFETMRHPWVWDLNAEYEDADGITHTPSGHNIYVSGVAQPSGTYSVNYNTGVVCFDTPPPGPITADYSFVNVPVYIANEVDWWTELQFRTTIPDESQFKQCTETGDWTIGSHHRVQLPTILVYAASTGSQQPFGISRGKTKREQDVVFHIISEDKCMRDNLVDLLIEQAGGCITLFNPDNAEMPLDCNGAKVNNNNYPELIDQYPWAYTRIDSGRIADLNSLRCGLHDGMVVFKTSTVFCGL